MLYQVLLLAFIFFFFKIRLITQIENEKDVQEFRSRCHTITSSLSNDTVTTVCRQRENEWSWIYKSSCRYFFLFVCLKDSVLQVSGMIETEFSFRMVLSIENFVRKRTPKVPKLRKVYLVGYLLSP